MQIYKIFRADEWSAFRLNGETNGAPVDVADGFIHFSTGSQVIETANKHFVAEVNLMLVAFDSDRLGDCLRWEPSRGGALFPHLYRPITYDEILWANPIERDEDGHRFPENLI